MVDIKLQIWDPPGERYMSLSTLYKGANGVLLVFDLSNKNSFYTEKFKQIIEFVKENTSGPLILMGNKVDLVSLDESEIKEEDIAQLQSNYNISEFIITSAKTGENIDSAFRKLTDLMVKEKLKHESLSETQVFKVGLAGVNSVGKTSIVQRYINKSFQRDYKITIGVQFYTKNVQYEPDLISDLREEKDLESISRRIESEEEKKGLLEELDVKEEIAPASEELKKDEAIKKARKTDEDRISLVRDRERAREQLEKAPAGMPRSAPAKPVSEVVAKKVERKATVFYKERMNPMKLNRMAVIISTKELYEALKIEREEIVRAATGKTYEIEKEIPILHVEPIIPGCICVPSTGKLDATKEYDHELFLITPLEVGEIPDARVDIYYKEKLIDSIPTPIEVVKTTMVKISSAFAIIFPIIGVLFDQWLDGVFKIIIPFYEAIGGLEGFIAILTGGFALMSAIFYYFRKPKDAKPVESKSLPEVVSAVSKE